MGYRLVCFDLDGTLIENTTYIWKTLHEKFNTDKKKRKEALDDFFAGRLSYHDWAVHDVNMWIKQGLRREDFMKALSHLKAVKKAYDTIIRLKDIGFKTAIISGSLDVALEGVFPDFMKIFDDIYINRLHFDDKGLLTGITPTPYDFSNKATALIQLAKKESITLKETVFIGDHDNDIEIAKKAGLSIAFNPKSEKLKNVSDIIIEENDLSLILEPIIRGKP